MMENDELKTPVIEPEKSGSKEEQEKQNESIDTIKIEGIPGGGLSQYPLSTIVKGIAELGIKGNSAMALLFSNTKRIETDLIEEREEKKKLTKDCNSWKEKYYIEKEQNSILKERLRAADKIKKLQSVSLTLGGLLCGIGIKNLIQQVDGISITFTLFGIIFLLTGWFWPNLFPGDN